MAIRPLFPGRIGIWRVGFCGGRKTGEPGEKPSEQERENYEKNDQQVFGDENFIQGSDKFAVGSKIRTTFLRVRSSRNTIQHPSAVIQFPPRRENRRALRLKFQELFKLT